MRHHFYRSNAVLRASLTFFFYQLSHLCRNICIIHPTVFLTVKSLACEEMEKEKHGDFYQLKPLFLSLEQSTNHENVNLNHNIHQNPIYKFKFNVK